jgi:hypothetical protein
MKQRAKDTDPSLLLRVDTALADRDNEAEIDH